MYKILADGHVLHDDQKSLRVTGAKLSLEIGKTGKLEFTMHTNHPYYTAVKPLKTMIEVQRHELTIFRGRALDFEYGFHNEKRVTCEGELAFLLDSIIQPDAYSGSFVNYLDYVLNHHNGQVEKEKQFKRGSVTVAEFYPFEVANDYEWLSSYEVLKGRMLDRTGGFLQVRHEYGEMYLDLLSPDVNVSNVSAQQIRLGKNLLDIKREVDGSEVFSAVIPLGAKIGETEKRLDIISVNDGLPYVSNSNAVELYGWIHRVVIFENITNAATLKSEALRYIAQNAAAVNSIEITAADLSGLNPELDSFEVGQWVEVVSGKHFENVQQLLVQKMTIDISNPAATTIEVGRIKRGLTEELGAISDGSVRSSDAVQPYVMESGTDGIFTWKIFSDNTCEFFGKVPVTSYDITSALGGWFRGANIYEAEAHPYPFTMTEAPAVEMTFQTRNGLAAIAWIFSQDADTAQSYLPQCYLIRPVAGSGIYGNINIIGKGKLA